MKPEQQLALAISQLACAVRESTEQRKQGLATSQQLADVFHKLTQVLAGKQDLEEARKQIMEAIQSFASRVTEKFNAIGASVDGLVEDITDLKQQIIDLQNSPGKLTPEDQAALDNIETLVGSTADKVAALDAATSKPPTPTP